MEEKDWESASTCDFYLSGRKGEEKNVCFLHRIISFFFQWTQLLRPFSSVLSPLFLIKVKGNREYPCTKREAPFPLAHHQANYIYKGGSQNMCKVIKNK